MFRIKKKEKKSKQGLKVQIIRNEKMISKRN